MPTKILKCNPKLIIFLKMFKENLNFNHKISFDNRMITCHGHFQFYNPSKLFNTAHTFRSYVGFQYGMHFLI